MNPPHHITTRSIGLPPPPFVEESLHEPSNTPFFSAGRFAPTWLEDFITGELYTGNGKVGCTAADAPIDSENKDKRHMLLIKGHQSFQEGSSEPYKMADGSPCDEVYSCVCQNCRHHFTFYIWRSLPDKISNSSRKLCGLTRKNQDDPFHHLLPTESQSHCPSNINNKYYPFLGSSTFVCSAVKCPFKVCIEVSGPRLTDEHLSVLSDNEKIIDRRKVAVETEPERFADVANIAPDALLYLRFYMRDIVDAKHDASGVPDADKKIDQRNKKFYIQFGDGPDAHKLFTFLGFEEVVEDGKHSWRVPAPTITRPTQPGSQLAFYQDIKSEIETIMGRVSQTLKPNAAISFITNALDFADYPQSPFAGKEEYKAEDYAALGLLPNMHESIFWWAFRCQAQTCPQEELRFFESVERLAEGRNCDDLIARIQSVADQIAKSSMPAYTADQDDYELERAKQMSLGQDVQPSNDVNSVEHEYTYFGLAEGQRSDQEVADKFRECIRSYPSQKSGYRTKLLKIARHRDNAMLRELATQDISVAEALDYLRISSMTDIPYLVSTTQAYINSSELDAGLAAEALKVVGDSKNASDREILYNLAGSLQMDNATPDFGNAPESTNVPLYLPVGLDNIRNTCYLNSILQYLFTVTEIRKIVLDYDDFALPSSLESLASRRIEPGQNTLSPAEFYAGRQFVTQLSILFKDLMTSQAKRIRPPQRLALGALKNAAQLEADGKAIASRQNQPSPSVVEIGPSVAPPVPPRSPAVVNHGTAPDMPSVQPAESSDVSDTISIKSSETLVDLTDADDKANVEHAEHIEHVEYAEHVERIESPEAGPEKTEEMTEKVEAPKPEATLESHIDLGLNDSSVTGTDQQDVEEVMGNIISHLRAAIKATGEDTDTDMQTDPITDLFYWTSATYTKKIADDNYSRLVSPGRVMTAYPSEKNNVISLLEGLDMSFRREFITENGLEQFTSIVKLPPILHIHIQRTTSTGGKNMTAIEIPLELHLDQFMDCDRNSELFAKRKRGWNLQERVASLTSFVKPLDPSETLTDFVQFAHSDKNMIREYLAQKGEKIAATELAPSNSESEPMDVDEAAPGPAPADPAGPAADDDDTEFVIINSDVQGWMDEESIEVQPPSAVVDLTEEATQWASLPETNKFFEEAGQMADEKIAESLVHESDARNAVDSVMDACTTLRETKNELLSLFADFRAPENKYLLHAVVCHGGSTGKSGHYWVWVYDFERRVWRRYNDSEVTQEANSDVVLRQLQSGEPYYLAYIRASEVEHLVNVQLREEPPPPPPPRSQVPPSPKSDDQMPPPPPPRPGHKSLPTVTFAPPPQPGPSPAYDEADAEYYNSQLQSFAVPAADQKEPSDDVEMKPAP